MRHYIYLLFLGLLVSFTSCRKDFDTVASSGNLEFSKTEVYLDTVFSTIGSSTYSLKVYNRSNDDIKIPIIQLGKGLNSKYRILVDGNTGNNKIFDNVELLAKDSMYIFVETTANIADTEPDFTYNDEILFDVGVKQQKVKLTTLVDDAIFIFPNRSLDKKIYEKITVNGFDPETRGHTLTDAELNWTNSKPYVIYGNCVVPAGKTLNISKGTRVHFHANATLIVDNGATLNIQGELNLFDGDGKVTTKNEVTFDGDRLEPEYEYVPGQWGAVFILSGTNNQINHLTLKNAVVGILVTRNINTTTPFVNIENSQIYDCSNYGILARSAVVNAKNLVMNAAGQTCFGMAEGGLYDLTHCTINNDWPSTKQNAIYIDNIITDQNGNPIDSVELNVNIKNSIIYGSNNVEFIINKTTISTTTPKPFDLNFEKCLIKFNDVNNQFVDPKFTQYDEIKNTDNFRNQDPKFKNADRNIMNITEGSAAIGKGNGAFSMFNDILNKPRFARSDIGAYQFLQ